jgi:hypothetical protein
VSHDDGGICLRFIEVVGQVRDLRPRPSSCS